MSDYLPVHSWLMHENFEIGFLSLFCNYYTTVCENYADDYERNLLKVFSNKCQEYRTKVLLTTENKGTIRFMNNYPGHIPSCHRGRLGRANKQQNTNL